MQKQSIVTMTENMLKVTAIHDKKSIPSHTKV